MRITSRIYIVGGGVWGGFGLSPGPDCNVYLIDCGSSLVLIDCGSGMAGSVEAILDNIEADGLSPQRIGTILITHKHGDHIGGAAKLAQRTSARVLASGETATVLANGDEQTSSITAAKNAGMYPQDLQLTPVRGVVVLEDRQRFEIGDCAFEVIATPGHCSGHISFLMRADGRADLIAGDAVFWRGRVVMQTLPDCDVAASGVSIERIAALGEIDGLYPGHGAFVIAGATRHVASALEHVRGLRVPPGL